MLDFVLSRLRRSHCRSTHQFIAIDALRHIDTNAGRRLATWLTYHHREFLSGVNDPDRRFRDFQNHVVHATDGFWGGAPRVAHQWYDRMLSRLDRGDMVEAARAAGILCHYFADPFTPLHTQHCERERVLHLPIEYAINVSYRDLFDLWKSDFHRPLTSLPESRIWLGETILKGAAVANGHYWTLISDFDLDSVLDSPRDSFGGRFAASASEMLGRSVTGLARTFERAASDWQQRNGREIPRCRLTRPWIRDFIAKLPGTIAKRRWHAKHRRRVERLVDEYARDGEVTRALPTEVDVMHRVIAVHRQEKRRLEMRIAKTPVHDLGESGIIAGRISPGTESNVANRRAA